MYNIAKKLKIYRKIIKGLRDYTINNVNNKILDLQSTFSNDINSFLSIGFSISIISFFISFGCILYIKFAISIYIKSQLIKLLYFHVSYLKFIYFRCKLENIDKIALKEVFLM